MRREQHEEVNREPEKQADEKIVNPFPDIEQDERLKAGTIPLPEVPKVTFSPPKTEAAGTKIGGDTAAEFRGMGLGYTIGIVLVTSILTGTGLGWLVDKFLLHSPVTPWGLIAGFFAGMVTGFVQMFSITNRINAEEDAASRARGKVVR